MSKEIERKFLVKELPIEISGVRPVRVIESYLAVGDEEIRVRMTMAGLETKCVMTIKRGKGLVREEIEFPIEEQTFDQLIQGETKTPIIKTRFTHIINGHEYMIDIFSNEKLFGLITAEVEFESEEAAKAFVKPNWLGNEVTEVESFKNQSLWIKIHDKQV